MKLKRNTALVLAGALALSAVPMNVFAYTVGGPLDAYDSYAASYAETSTPSTTGISATAAITGVTTVQGRTLLVAGQRTTEKLESTKLNVEYSAPAPYIQLTVNHDEQLLDTDIVYKVTLANGEFINTTSGSTSKGLSDLEKPVSTEARVNGYLNKGFKDVTTPAATSTAIGGDGSLVNTYVMPNGVIFKRVSKTEAYIIIDSEYYGKAGNWGKSMDVAADSSNTTTGGVTRFNIPLIARTTSETAPLTVTLDGKANGLSIGDLSATAATNVVGVSNAAGYASVGTSVSRKTIRPTIKLTEYAAGNFDTEGWVVINFNNGVLPAATGKDTLLGKYSGKAYSAEEIAQYFDVVGFGIDTTLDQIDEKATEVLYIEEASHDDKGYTAPSFLRRNETELWVNMNAFEPNSSTVEQNFISTENGLHAETLAITVQLNRKGDKFTEVSAKVDWESDTTTYIATTNLAVGAFSDYDYTFTTVKDTTVSGFEYPVFLGNRGFIVDTYYGYNNYDEDKMTGSVGINGVAGTKEGAYNDDYQVLDLYIKDSVDNSILWNNREFDIVFSDNVRVMGYEILKTEYFDDNAPTTENFSFLNEAELAKALAGKDHKTFYTNVLSYDGNISDEPTENVTPNIDAKDGETAGIVLRVYVDNTTYKSGDITARMEGNALTVDSDEVKVGEIVQSIDLVADLTELQQIAGPQLAGDITVSELVPGQLNEDEYYNLTLIQPDYWAAATSTWGFYTVGDLTVNGVDEDDNLDETAFGVEEVFATEDAESYIQVDLEGLTESDSVDELRSFTLSGVQVLLGTLFTMPTDNFSVEVSSELKDELVGEELWGFDAVAEATGVTKEKYYYDVEDESVDKAVTVDYLTAEAVSTDGGSYADYLATFNADYHDDITMTIGATTFTYAGTDEEGAATTVTGEYEVGSNDPELYVPKLVGDDTYVSIRSLAQTIGGEVTWNQATQTVFIYPQGYESYLNGDGARATVSYANPSVVEFKEPGKEVVYLEIKNQVGNSVSMLTIDEVNHLPYRFFAESIYKVKGIDVSEFSTSQSFTIDAK